MIIKDELKVTEGGKRTTPALKGKTTIELRDAKTGELVHKQVEHNMVTNYFQGPYSHEICATYTQQPTDLFAQVKGVQLLNHAEEEDPSNVAMEVSGSAVTGFGNLQVNANQTNTKWMSCNQLETGKTTNGYRWVWNANENQCNGPIECVSLITADMNTKRLTSQPATTYSTINFEPMFNNRMMGMFLGKWIDTPGNQNNGTFSTGTFSNIVHIDWASEVMYDIERDYDNDKKITILRYQMNRDKINLRYRLKPTLLDSHEIIFQNSLNHDYVQSTSYTYARPFSVKVEGNTMYLVKSGAASYTQYTNLLRVIKINLTDYTYTDEVKTLTQSYMDYYNGQRNTVDKARNFHFIKDYHPILDGYVYLIGASGSNALYKVRLDDVSDITVYDTTDAVLRGPYNVSPPLNIVTEQNIILSGYRTQSSLYNNWAACISLKDGTVSPTIIGGSMPYIHNSNGLYQGSSSALWNSEGYHCFADLTDGVLTIVHSTPWSGSESDLYSGLVYIDQYRCNDCMVTINNQSPVVKTSDNTMKVTYELSEATEV